MGQGPGAWGMEGGCGPYCHYFWAELVFFASEAVEWLAPKLQKVLAEISSSSISAYQEHAKAEFQ